MSVKNLSAKIKKATRKTKKLRLAVTAQPGGGKTYTSLLLAKTICNENPNPKILVFDTEYGRASLYADYYDFDVWEFDPKEEGRSVSYKDYVEVIKFAEQEKYDVVILDSTTPEWEDMERIKHKKVEAAKKPNEWRIWGEVKAGPHQEFLNAILYSDIHIIATIRSKEKSEMVGGKVVSKGVGEQQDSDLKFFLDFVFEIQDRDSHTGTLSKAPPGLYEKYEGLGGIKIGDKFCDDIKIWLNSGLPVEIYNFIIRLKQLNSEYESLTGSGWEKLPKEEELEKMDKTQLTQLGQNLSEAVKNTKTKKGN